MRRPTRLTFALAPLLALCLTTPAARAQAPAPAAAAPKEEDYYRLVTLPVPEGVVLEVGGLETLPDGRLAVATRRGDVWLVGNPGMEGGGDARPTFTRFARGLHEPLGLTYRDGAFYTAQRGELTRLRDTDGDGRADRYEALATWPLSGNYHEYAFGPTFDARGHLLVTLNLAWVGRGASLVPWRGWMMDVAPNGTVTPVATGMRSPAAFGFNLAGDLFYAENQGDWVGSGGITHVVPGDFVGHPDGLRWASDPRSPVRLRPEDVPDTGEPKYEVAKRVPGLKTPAVWFPHTIMGISTSGILVDSTRGAFGPYAGQLFVGDQGHSKVMRVFLERVDGVYQGVVFPFREGFSSGVLREAWGPGGSMYVGMTSRGWGSTGKEPYGLQRLVWTGRTPFEAHRVEARPDGFEVVFTAPADRATAADPASYAVSGFTYKYHHDYGSPVVDRREHAVRHVALSADGLRARLVVPGLRAGYIHEVKWGGVRAADGAPPLHDVGYYTLNRVPSGPGLTVPAAALAAVPRARAARDTAARPLGAAGARPTRAAAPARAAGGAVDATLAVAAQTGLRFAPTRLDVRAGRRVRLVLENAGDMQHNLVVVAPGRADAVHEASMRMGLRGAEQQYVPRSRDVLVHTQLLEPGRSDAIVFRAPAAPGDYPFLCTFPGHGITMRGVLHVTP